MINAQSFRVVSFGLFLPSPALTFIDNKLLNIIVKE